MATPLLVATGKYCQSHSRVFFFRHNHISSLILPVLWKHIPKQAVSRCPYCYYPGPHLGYHGSLLTGLCFHLCLFIACSQPWRQSNLVKFQTASKPSDGFPLLSGEMANTCNNLLPFRLYLLFWFLLLTLHQAQLPALGTLPALGRCTCYYLCLECLLRCLSLSWGLCPNVNLSAGPTLTTFHKTVALLIGLSVPLHLLYCILPWCWFPLMSK